jgi:predicted nucleotidyltransferase component of viral defense system
MSLLDRLADTAVEVHAGYAALRPVIEKEILHHDILREMNDAEFLKHLTFIGGTCLRSCYGSTRLSEDLDFSGGFGFTRQDMSGLGDILRDGLQKKYELPVTVTEPVRETGNTDTWKIKMITRPEKADLPAQRINIDICLLPSYDRKPVILKNHYGIDLGTSGMILYAESLEEIYADKIVALALRPNRIKNRDLWDINWLNSRNISPDHNLVEKKLADRGITAADFWQIYRRRVDDLKNGQKDFLAELRRFLSPVEFDVGFTSPLWWEQLLLALNNLAGPYFRPSPK